MLTYFNFSGNAYLLASSMTEYRKKDGGDRDFDRVMSAFAQLSRRLAILETIFTQLLSLVNPADASSLIKPDYRASVADVFTNLTRTVIDKQGRSGFLHRVRWTGNSNMSLPSWVVTRDALRGGPILMPPMAFSASKGLKGTWKFTEAGEGTRCSRPPH